MRANRARPDCKGFVSHAEELDFFFFFFLDFFSGASGNLLKNFREGGNVLIGSEGTETR